MCWASEWQCILGPPVIGLSSSWTEQLRDPLALQHAKHFGPFSFWFYNHIYKSCFENIYSIVSVSLQSPNQFKGNINL